MAGRLVFRTPPSPTRYVALTDDGSGLATCGPEGHVSLWDVGSGRRHPLDIPIGQYVRGMHFSADGTRVARRSGLRTGGVWDADESTLLTRMELDDYLWHLDLSADGTHAITGGRGRKVSLWDVDAGAKLFDVTVASNSNAVALDAHASRFAVARGGSVFATIEIWAVARGN
ncbi:WD40 repeat domain-containing protein [Streptomyces sp. NPDC002467]